MHELLKRAGPVLPSQTLETQTHWHYDVVWLQIEPNKVDVWPILPRTRTPIRPLANGEFMVLLTSALTLKAPWNVGPCSKSGLCRVAEVIDSGRATKRVPRRF